LERRGEERGWRAEQSRAEQRRGEERRGEERGLLQQQAEGPHLHHYNGCKNPQPTQP
jgi:hypothetical protein